MFKKGDKVVYGNVGVCEVKDISRSQAHGLDPDRDYYVLEPDGQSCVIYVPADSPKVFMRPVISAQEADRLIDMIPSISAQAYHAGTIQGLAEHYKTMMDSHDCADLIELVMSIYAKKSAAESRSRKIGSVDARFMKQAEELLNGEFAAALGLSRDEVPHYIAQRVRAAGERRAAAASRS